MKKVIIGILIFIPILILLVIAAVTTIVSVSAYVSVDNIILESNDDKYMLDLKFEDKTYDFNDYYTYKIEPVFATNKTVVWSIDGINILDSEYSKRYNEYMENKDNPDYTGEVVYPAVMFVDDNDEQVESNTTGKFRVNTYCEFSVSIQAEQEISKNMFVKVGGYDVESITIIGEDNFVVGQSESLEAVYNPVTSSVLQGSWSSSNPLVARVDSNGIVTAVSTGTAQIIMSAKIASTDSFVKSEAFTVTISEGISKYGASITISDDNELKQTTLGLKNPRDYVNVVYDRATDVLTVIDKSKPATINTDLGQFTINSCDPTDIAIENAKHFEYIPSDNGASENDSYVFAMNEMPLSLTVKWLDDLNSQNITGVVWSSDNEEIATVSNGGIVKGLKRGIVTITATLGQKTATIELHVEQKLVSFMLEKTDKNMQVGLAKETVFASTRFNSDGEITRNWIDINIKLPAPPTDEWENAMFYDAFNIFVEEQHKDKVVIIGNRLYFVPDNIVGKIDIKVTIQAKYPRYENFQTYTKQTITLKVINGIQVSNRDEFGKVSELNKIVFMNNENLDEDLVPLENPNLNIVIKPVPAVVLSSDILFEDIHNSAVGLYGSLYGNGNKISANKLTSPSDSYDGHIPYMIQVYYHNTTISNTVFRMNELGSEDNTNPEVTRELVNGEALKFEPRVWDDYDLFLENMVVEFSIFENGARAFQSRNADLLLDGCIIRNMSVCGIWLPTYQYSPESGSYSLFNINNVVGSNLIGTFMSIDNIYDMKDTELMEATFEQGYKSVVTQTGFFDIYNWQDAYTATIIDTGNDFANALISSALTRVLENAIEIEEFSIYETNNNITTLYFHFGMLSTAMEGSSFQPSITDVIFEDKRWHSFNTKDLTNEFGDAIIPIDIVFYLYKNDADIQPHMSYKIDSDFIDRLHGE